MKLITDCVRDTLLFLEQNLDGKHPISVQTISDSLTKYSYEDIHYTCLKLDEASLIKTTKWIIGIRIIEDITYDGHQFLNTIRNNNTWNKIKSFLSKTTVITIPIMQEIATKIALDSLNVN